MQTIYDYSRKYIEPMIDHPWIKGMGALTGETIKILAAKFFLELLVEMSLIDPRKAPKKRLYDVVVVAPIVEELIFRFVILGTIGLIQRSLTKQSYRLASPLFETDKPKKTNKQEKRCLNLYLPLELELIHHGVKKFTQFIRPVKSQKEKENLDETIQRCFRVYVSAFIFAALHLENFHRNKTSALIQFSWSFIGGISCGHLTEKYGSIAPAIVTHGLNNMIAMMFHYASDKMKPFYLIAIAANKVATYFLGVTQIDHVIFEGVTKSLTGGASSLQDGDQHKIEKGMEN
ncbi:MAG: lysostaphin resistance A-like protein [Parachlamydiaceae bacterium]